MINNNEYPKGLDYAEKTHKQYRLKNRVTQFIVQIYKMVDVI